MAHDSAPIWLLLATLLHITAGEHLRFDSGAPQRDDSSGIKAEGEPAILRKNDGDILDDSGDGNVVSIDIEKLHEPKIQTRMSRFGDGKALLVLARYHEDVQWVYGRSFPILILNRASGDPLVKHKPVKHKTGRAVHSEPKLPRQPPEPQNTSGVFVQPDTENIGREGYVYLRYILENYDEGRFPDVVGFCQAKPNSYGYSPNHLVDDMKRLRALMTKETLPGKPGNPRWSNISRDIQRDGFAFLGAQMYPGSFHDEKCRNFFQEFMPNCRIQDQSFVPGGCFAVTRQQILANSKEWYYRWHDPDHPQNKGRNPNLGYVKERAWGCIFTEPGRQCNCTARSKAARSSDSATGQRPAPLVQRDF